MLRVEETRAWRRHPGHAEVEFWRLWLKGRSQGYRRFTEGHEGQ
jgi:hypothetical protein